MTYFIIFQDVQDGRNIILGFANFQNFRLVFSIAYKNQHTFVILHEGSRFCNVRQIWSDFVRISHKIQFEDFDESSITTAFLEKLSEKPVEVSQFVVHLRSICKNRAFMFSKWFLRLARCSGGEETGLRWFDGGVG